MKGQPFSKRVGFAGRGLAETFRRETSFRTHVLFAFAAISFTLLIHPPLIWLALILVIICLILALELFNTALEHTLDGLHPEKASFVGLAKDCAAASVLVLSGCSVIVFLLMLFVVYA